MGECPLPVLLPLTPSGSILLRNFCPTLASDLGLPLGLSCFVLFCFVLFLFKLQWNLSQKVCGWLLEDENLSFQKNPYIHRDLKAEGCLAPPSFLHQGKTSLTECQIEKTGSPVKELESRQLPQKSTARTARRTRETELDPKVPIASWVTDMEAR